MSGPENVIIDNQTDGVYLQLLIDPTKRLGMSASGKTITVASTHGFTPVQMENGVTLYISLNAFVYPPRPEKRKGGGSDLPSL